MAQSKSKSTKAEPTVLTVAPKARKRRGRSDKVAERHLNLDGMADGAGPMVIKSEDDPTVVLAEFAKAFVITADMLGVSGGSIPVTIGTWAEDRGRSVTVVSRFTDDDARIVVLS